MVKLLCAPFFNDRGGYKGKQSKAKQSKGKQNRNVVDHVSFFPSTILTARISNMSYNERSVIVK